ncbi:hypothetical protein GCM10028801_11270 [Nocardioides maradonensis]
METRLVTVVAVLAAALLGAAVTTGTAVAVVVAILALGLAALATLGPRRLGVAALGGSFATAPMYRGIGSLGPITPTDGLLFIGLALLLPVAIRRRVEAPGMLVVPTLVLAVLGMVASVVANPAPAASIVYVVQWLIVFSVLPMFLLVLKPSGRLVDGLLWCYIAGQMASTLKALAMGAAANGRYQGFAHHSNDFGLAGSVAAVAVLYLLPRYRNVWVRVLLLGLGAASLYSIVMSGSRGSTLAVAVVILFVPIVERSGVWAVLLTACGALGLALLPFVTQVGGAGGSLSRLSGDATAAASDSERTQALAEGWHRFLSSPFLGSGLDPLVGEYHNLFLEVAIAVGVVGLGAYLVICYLVARPLFTTHPQRRLSYLAWLFIISGITFPGLVDRTILVPMSLAILAVVPVRETDEPAVVGDEAAALP